MNLKQWLENFNSIMAEIKREKDCACVFCRGLDAWQEGYPELMKAIEWQENTSLEALNQPLPDDPTERIDKLRDEWDEPYFTVAVDPAKSQDETAYVQVNPDGTVQQPQELACYKKMNEKQVSLIAKQAQELAKLKKLNREFNLAVHHKTDIDEIIRRGEREIELMNDNLILGVQRNVLQRELAELKAQLAKYEKHESLISDGTVDAIVFENNALKAEINGRRRRMED